MTFNRQGVCVVSRESNMKIMPIQVIRAICAWVGGGYLDFNLLFCLGWGRGLEWSGKHNLQYHQIHTTIQFDMTQESKTKVIKFKLFLKNR